MTHEFCTPVSAIQALTSLLLERLDGPLTSEQEKQVLYIRRAADDLSDLVTDLLDLARVEAGKIVIRPIDFEVEALFGALRGMLRPLLQGESVSLVFEELDGVPPLHTDEGKVSQILRNFISNALKFTERGEVRVSCRFVEASRMVVFSVADTGIGIAKEDQEKIFQEFVQLESPLQNRVKGTGLGLPLCRRLAELLGGSVSVESRPGQGSTFRAHIPLVYVPTDPSIASDWELDPSRMPILVVEDARETALLYEKFLNGSGYQPIVARTLGEARSALATFSPRAILLDILLQGESAWSFLMELKRDPKTRSIPLIVVTELDDQRKALALGADDYLRKPVTSSELLERIGRHTTGDLLRILAIDDDEMARYVLRQYLHGPRLELLEASSGLEGVEKARAERPDVICLDLVMPGLSGLDVLEQLDQSSATEGIPVVIVSSLHLEDAQRQRLPRNVASLIEKSRMSRDELLTAVRDAATRRIPTLS
jgi:CheY-like chemotaxis protein